MFIVLQRCFQILFLDDRMMGRVSLRKRWLTHVFWILFALAWASALGNVFFPDRYGGVISYHPDFIAILGQVLIFFIFYGLALYLSAFVLERFFVVDSNFDQFFLVMGHASLVGLFFVIPTLAPLAVFWYFIVMCRFLSDLAHMPHWKILLFFLFQFILYWALAFLVSLSGLLAVQSAWFLI